MALDEVGAFSESWESFGGSFERITPPGSKPALLLCSDFPLTAGRDGNIYYANTRSGSGGIVRRTPSGLESVLASGTMFEGVTGMASGPDGSIYATDATHADANVIRRITMEGTVSIRAKGFVRNTSSDHVPSGMNLGYCRGLAVDSTGNVYVAAAGSRSVLRITPEGHVAVVLASASPWLPTGVAVFRGELYVLEWHDVAPSLAEVRTAWLPRVRKVGRDGQITTLATIAR